MTRTRHLIGLVTGLGLAAALWATPSFAAGQFMCAPEPSVGVSGPRRVTNVNTGNSYALNALGCALMRNDDAQWALSQGFTFGGNDFTQVFTQQTTGFTFTMPTSSFIRNIILHEGTGNAVASGICLGSSNGASDVATQAGTASLLKAIPDSSIAKRVLSTTAPSTVWFNACNYGGFGSAIWDVTIELGFF